VGAISKNTLAGWAMPFLDKQLQALNHLKNGYSI
jgi:hypothetical protein